MADKIDISVVMGVYNEPQQQLEKAIDSILEQSFNNFEFIIINDNPKLERLRTTLQAYADKDDRIKILNNEQNIGLTKSLNLGLAAAQGKYVARMDADDISKPNRLQRQFEFMEANPACVLSGSYFTILKDDTILNEVSFPTESSDIESFLLVENCIPHPAAIIKVETLKKHNLTYNPAYRYSQDYGLWCELVKYGQLRNIPESLIYYRISENQISTSKRDEQKAILEDIRKDYFAYVLSKLNISVSDKNLYKRIKGLDVDTARKSFLLKSYYVNSEKGLVNKMLTISLSGDSYLLDDKFKHLLKVNSNVYQSLKKSKRKIFSLIKK